ncbi:ATP dependent DNA ligase domain-containing [Lecanosticta acicola]|uniref:ATP dependent DNA ligase domain-containing n=1 Tax=Lecanosticta acicola TaxID=111012 RepID=A0AAI8YT36_9PEZI|nr:ATP dependent DNA ligase domain-containing [Lecanosticta acicola]
MPFPFSELTTLLQRLEDVETHEPPLLKDSKYARTREIIASWFKSHRRGLLELSIDGTAALFSALLPEWRTDRVYGIQTHRLHRILCRTLQLGLSQKKDLEAYRQPGNGDLALCLERVMALGGTQATPIVMLEEVDAMLQVLAGGSAFSGPAIPSLPPGSSEVRDRLLGHILKRLRPQEGKWLARMILKNFSPLRIDENLLLENYHFLLPDLLRFQKDFTAAARLLKNELHEYPERPDPRSETLLRRQAAERIRPVVGTQISRPNFYKARSIDSCSKMLDRRSWVLERKYDGEYCEIHIDLRQSPDPAKCIKIFSKSGKDSTADRAGVHQTVIDSLRLGHRNCRFRKQAILLGELVVFSDEQDEILPFEKIRKHVSRSGRFIGTDEDSQAHAHEHLAIVYFDLLLLDDEVVMNKPIEERRMWLRETYRKIHGRAIGSEWKIVDFSSPDKARKHLLDQFAASNARRCEGLVLKPCGVPYLALDATTSYQRSFIKLKEDYIHGLGDEADFAVVGASYDAQQAATSGLTNIKWTTFHLACLTNSEDVRRVDVRPNFKHVGSIKQEHCISRTILHTINQLGAFTAQPYDRNAAPQSFDVDATQPLKMDVIFEKPFVFEVLGSGFEQPSNSSFFMLRHARVKKLHEDRTWRDCITFQDLQEQAKTSRAAPDTSESQEIRRELEKLERSCRRKFDREKSATSGSSTRRTATPRSSIASISLRRSPNKPVIQRTVATTPTPTAPGAVPATTSSRLQQVFPPERQVSIGKRTSDQATALVENPAKRPRTEPLVERDSRIPAPLQEITINTDARSSREGTRTIHQSQAVSERTRQLVSLICPRQKNTFSPERHISKAACEGSRCPFSNTVVFLTPCIAQTLYITEDLLSTHNVEIATDISHWDRAGFSHPPLTDTVSESQSHPGMRKIILVERKRRTAVRDIVHTIQTLNHGRLRERIEVYDWRVLEDCAAHDRSADAVKGRFLGATMFDDTRERCVFVGEGG